ncbi:unnamed protein product, partial [Cyprideis torosa]
MEWKGQDEEKTLGSILLPSYKISPCSPEHGRRKHAFKIQHQNMRTYYFASESREAMLKWMNHLSLASIMHSNSGNSGNLIEMHQQQQQPYPEPAIGSHSVSPSAHQPPPSAHQSPPSSSVISQRSNGELSPSRHHSQPPPQRPATYHPSRAPLHPPNYPSGNHVRPHSADPGAMPNKA